MGDLVSDLGTDETGRGQTRHVRLDRGRLLDAQIIKRFELDLIGHVEGSSPVILDLEGVEFLSSAAVGAVVKAAMRHEVVHRKPLSVCSLGPELKGVFRTTGLVNAIPTYSSYDSYANGEDQLSKGNLY